MNFRAIYQAYLQFALFPALMIQLCRCVAIDNGIVGDPEVQCMDDSIMFTFRTEKQFTGRVFVKGRSQDPQCSSNYADNTESSPQSIVVSLGSCGMRRIRATRPAGMKMLITVVLSFHPIFITKVDRAYAINCFFRPALKTVTQMLDVSMIPVSELSSTAEMPNCGYSIRKGSPDGETARFVKVGDKVVHVWQCETTDPDLKMLVHSCSAAKPGIEDKVDIVDELGCSTDIILLGEVEYDSAKSLAYASSHAYKYADVASITFTCTIKMCRDPECPQLPPDCLEARFAASKRRLSDPRPRPARETAFSITSDDPPQTSSGVQTPFITIVSASKKSDSGPQRLAKLPDQENYSKSIHNFSKLPDQTSANLLSDRESSFEILMGRFASAKALGEALKRSDSSKVSLDNLTNAPPAKDLKAPNHHHNKQLSTKKNNFRKLTTATTFDLGTISSAIASIGASKSTKSAKSTTSIATPTTIAQPTTESMFDFSIDQPVESTSYNEFDAVFKHLLLNLPGSGIELNSNGENVSTAWDNDQFFPRSSHTVGTSSEEIMGLQALLNRIRQRQPNLDYEQFASTDEIEDNLSQEKSSENLDNIGQRDNEGRTLGLTKVQNIRPEGTRSTGEIDPKDSDRDIFDNSEYYETFRHKEFDKKVSDTVQTGAFRPGEGSMDVESEELLVLDIGNDITSTLGSEVLILDLRNDSAEESAPGVEQLFGNYVDSTTKAPTTREQAKRSSTGYRHQIFGSVADINFINSSNESSRVRNRPKSIPTLLHHPNSVSPSNDDEKLRRLKIDRPDLIDSFINFGQTDDVCIPHKMFSIMVISTLLSFLLATLITIIVFGKFVNKFWNSRVQMGIEPSMSSSSIIQTGLHYPASPRTHQTTTANNANNNSNNYARSYRSYWPHVQDPSRDPLSSYFGMVYR